MVKLFADEITNDHHFGVKFEARATFAKELLAHFGVVAGTLGKEDSQGRSTLILQDPKELVARAFAISDAFFDMSEERGDIQETELSMEEVHERRGRLAHIQRESEWKRQESTQSTGGK